MIGNGLTKLPFEVRIPRPTNVVSPACLARKSRPMIRLGFKSRNRVNKAPNHIRVSNISDLDLIKPVALR